MPYQEVREKSRKMKVEKSSYLVRTLDYISRSEFFCMLKATLSCSKTILSMLNHCFKHLLTDCVVSAEKYLDCSFGVWTERSEGLKSSIFQHWSSNRLTVRTLPHDNCIKRRMHGLNWQRNTDWYKYGRYCPESNQSYFSINGPRRCILCGHIIKCIIIHI